MDNAEKSGCKAVLSNNGWLIETGNPDLPCLRESEPGSPTVIRLGNLAACDTTGICAASIFLGEE